MFVIFKSWINSQKFRSDLEVQENDNSLYISYYHHMITTYYPAVIVAVRLILYIISNVMILSLAQIVTQAKI